MVYVVERYLPGLTRSDLLRGLSRLEAEEQVRYLGSTIVLEDEACFCQFEGPSEAAVAEANRRAGLSFDRIVPALSVNPFERSTPMQVSTSLPAPVRIGRPRILGVLAVAAAVVAIGAWAIVAYAVGSGSPSVAMTKQDRQYVAGITSLSPAALQAAFGTPTAESRYVDSIVALTPVQLVAAFGTDVQAAAALASLGPQERLHVQELMALTPAQLRAAFGTGK